MPLALSKKNFVPTRDRDFAAFAQQFFSVTQGATFLGYGGTTAMSAAMTSLYNAWTAAFSAWIPTASRNTNISNAKKNARKALENEIRAITDAVQGWIRSDFRASPSTRLGPDEAFLGLLDVTVPSWLNLNLGDGPNSGRKPSHVPMVAPKLFITSKETGQLTFTYDNTSRDANGPRTSVTHKAKPNGVLGVLVEVMCPRVPAGNVTLLMLRSPQTFPVPQFVGYDVIARARYVGRKGEYGPWGDRVGYIVPHNPLILRAADAASIGTPVGARGPFNQ